MKGLSRIPDCGQSVWLGELSRRAIEDGQLSQAVKDRGISGATFSITALHRDIQQSSSYDRLISHHLHHGLSGTELLNTLLIEDARQAADILRPVYDSSGQQEGWVVTPLSPLICTATLEDESTLVKQHEMINRPNVLHMIAGRPSSMTSIEEAIYAGYPVAISPICSGAQYMQAARSYLSAIKRRLDHDRRAGVCAIVIVPITRILALLAEELEPDAAMKSCIAVSNDISQAVQELHLSQAWNDISGTGVWPLRLLWMTTPTPAFPELSALQKAALSSPHSIAAIPETDLAALNRYDSGQVNMSAEHERCLHDTPAEPWLHHYATLADKFQVMFAREEEQNWICLLDTIASKSATLAHQSIIDTGG